MYLRTTKRKNRDGSVVVYYQLAHNERHPETKVSTPRVIHNFGRADLVDRDELVRLCHSIAKVCGLVIHDPVGQGEEPTFEEGLAQEINLIGTVELGPVVVIEALWLRLGIGQVFKAVAQSEGCKESYERALLAMTANRLCEPQSKLGVWERWLSQVFLPSCDELKLADMYEAMDLFHKHCNAIEQSIFFATADLLNLDVDVVFYDTTTASFTLDEADGDDDETQQAGLRQFGRPKEGGWKVQVVVALAVTREGFPVRSWVFPGNTTDITTVEQVKADLKGWKLGRALFVADAGMNSEDMRQALAKACGKYLLAARMASVKEIKQEVLADTRRYRKLKPNLQAKEVIIGEGVRQRRYIVCYNPKEAKRERQHREQVVKDLKRLLSQHKDQLATAQWAVTLKASGRYGRYLKITKDNQLRIDQQAIQQAAQYDGKWVIQTNDDTITLEDAACGYKALLVIEQCFRSLKQTQIKMTPMFHWLPHRIEVHIKICVLALLIERVAEHTCQQPWSRIRHHLRALQATQFHTKEFCFFQRNQPSKEVSAIFNKLNIPLPKPVLSISPRS